MTFYKWPKGPVILLIFSILMFLIPKSFEGPEIFSFGSYQGLSVLNTMALIPLLFSVYWIQRGLWRRRIHLFNRVTLYPGAGSLIVFLMGLGLGMLIAAGFKDFQYWWAIGGILFIFVLIVVVLKSGSGKVSE